MNMLVINTSSSLFFIRVGLIPYLLRYFKLITSKEILKEIKEGEQIGFKDAKIMLQYFDESKIELINAKQTHSIVKEFNIKNADASVVSLAKELDCFLATEDRQIEKISLIKQTKLTNTALLVYFLWKKEEFSEKQALLLLDLLIRNGYNKEVCLKIKEKILQGEKNV